MTMTFRKAITIGISTAAAVFVLGVIGINNSATAHAGDMNISASGGDGTTVDKDGTQGDFKPAVQGTARTGDQDAYANDSWEATPQYRSKK